MTVEQYLQPDCSCEGYLPNSGWCEEHSRMAREVLAAEVIRLREMVKNAQDAAFKMLDVDVMNAIQRAEIAETEIKQLKDEMDCSYTRENRFNACKSRADTAEFALLTADKEHIELNNKIEQLQEELKFYQSWWKTCASDRDKSPMQTLMERTKIAETKISELEESLEVECQYRDSYRLDCNYFIDKLKRIYSEKIPLPTPCRETYLRNIAKEALQERT
jgi:hypothetical protein